MFCREHDGTRGGVLELGTDVVWDAYHDHQSRIPAVCARVHQWAAKAATEEERRAFLEMADAWTRVALVDRVSTTPFAADANGAKRQIHF